MTRPAGSTRVAATHANAVVRDESEQIDHTTSDNLAGIAERAHVPFELLSNSIVNATSAETAGPRSCARGHWSDGGGTGVLPTI